MSANYGHRAGPGGPVEEVDVRLLNTSTACIEAYRAWRQPGSEDAGPALADAIHELRRVMARIEIELGANSRPEEQAAVTHHHRGPGRPGTR